MPCAICSALALWYADHCSAKLMRALSRLMCSQDGRLFFNGGFVAFGLGFASGLLICGRGAGNGVFTTGAASARGAAGGATNAGGGVGAAGLGGGPPVRLTVPAASAATSAKARARSPVTSSELPASVAARLAGPARAQAERLQALCRGYRQRRSSQQRRYPVRLTAALRQLPTHSDPRPERR